jgi:hypothetical protein
MKLEDLQKFHQLCPDVSSLVLDCDEDFENLKFIPTFKEISEISFNSQSFKFSLLTEILKDFKQNKLTKLSFSNTGQQISLEFLKTLFSVTNLVEFEVRSLCKEEEFKLVSSWIETNSHLKLLHLNCISFYYNFK